MTDFWEQVLNFAETTTKRVGEQLLEDFGSATATEKADGSLVTQSDLRSDAQIRASIAEAFPEHGILAEESDRTFPDREWCWVVDPIDGTTNFARRVPIWAISMGLLYRGTPVFGFVHCPPIRQTFHGFWYGSSGLTGPTGAFLNGQPICVSSASPSPNQLFSFCSRSLEVIEHPFPCKIRMLGVATYNLLTVATGVCLGAVEATPKIWDIAAVLPIVQAAGGVWIFLNDDREFPLESGRDYSRYSFPSLVVAGTNIGEAFQPLVSSLGNRGL
jgi:myo-inositol-1(or 4)-monophosphatase